MSSVPEVLHAGLPAQFLVALSQQLVPYLEVKNDYLEEYFISDI